MHLSLLSLSYHLFFFLSLTTMNPTTISETPIGFSSAPPPTSDVSPLATPQCETRVEKTIAGGSNPSEASKAPLASYGQIVSNQKMFLHTLADLHRSFGTKLWVPTVGKRSLDLHKLFVEVTARGGFEKVIENRNWKVISAILNIPVTITNVSNALQKHYKSLLLRYEEIYYRGREPQQGSLTSTGNNPASQPSASQPSASPQGPIPLDNQSQAQTEPLPIIGVIDKEIANGYVVTVTMGEEKLKGVLYYAPIDEENSETPLPLPPKKKQKTVGRKSGSKPNRSPYNIFFAEQYARLRPLHDDGTSNMSICGFSAEIGKLWSELSATEKQVYNERLLAMRQSEGSASAPADEVNLRKE